MNISTLFTLLAVALLSVVLLAVHRVEGTGAAGVAGVTKYVQADTCCVGCQYNSGSCCCGRHPLKPYTKTKKVTHTKVFTRTKTATGVAARERRLVVDLALVEEEAEPSLAEAGDAPIDGPAQTVEAPALFARHLCSTCPKGIIVSKKGKHNNGGGSNIVFCCPARKTKTITRTIKTVTKTVIKTQTVKKPLSISGRLYRDVNNNNIFDLGIDVPYANTQVSLILLAKKSLLVRAAPRASGTVLATNITDSQGEFTFNVATSTPVPTSASLGIVEPGQPDALLKTFTVDAAGTVNYVEAPVPQSKTMTTKTSKAAITTGASMTTHILPAGATTTKESLVQTTAKQGQTTQQITSGRETTTAGAPAGTTTAAAIPGETTTAAGSPSAGSTTVGAAGLTTKATSTSASETKSTFTETSSTITVTSTSTLPPTLRWEVVSDKASTGEIYPVSMERDNQGFIYVAGSFTAEWIAIGGVNVSKPGSKADTFVAKLTPNLTAVWIRAVGSDNGDEYLERMYLNSATGESYLTAGCASTGFNYSTWHFAQCAGFLAKIDASGGVSWILGSGNRSYNSNDFIKSCTVHGTAGLFCTSPLSSGSLTFGNFVLSTTTGSTALVTLNETTGTVINATKIGMNLLYHSHYLTHIGNAGPLSTGPLFLYGLGKGNLTFGGASTESAPKLSSATQALAMSVNADYTANWIRYYGNFGADADMEDVKPIAVKSDGSEVLVMAAFYEPWTCGTDAMERLPWWSTQAMAFAIKISASTGDCISGVASQGPDADTVRFLAARYTQDGAVYIGGYSSQPYVTGLSNGQNASVGPTASEINAAIAMRFEPGAGFTMSKSISVGGATGNEEDFVASFVIDDDERLYMMAQLSGNGVINSTPFYVDSKQYNDTAGNLIYLQASTVLAMGLTYANMTGWPNSS